VKCIVNDFTADELKEMESIYQEAEKRFYFLSDRTDIANGSRIIFDNITYEIIRVIKQTMAGNTYTIEAWGKPV